MSDVSIVTFNMHWGQSARGEEFDVKDVLKACHGDVVVFQEAWVPKYGDDRVGDAAAALGYDLVHVPLTDRADIAGHRVVRDERGGQGTWGLAVLSRIGRVCIRETLVLAQARRDPVRRLAVVFEPEGTGLVVVGTHLTHRIPFSLLQLAQIRRLAMRSAAVAVAGDLNCPRLVAAAACWPSFASPNCGASWPAHRPMTQLDQVLLGRRVTAVRAEVLAVGGSDHLPVRVVARVS